MTALGIAADGAPIDVDLDELIGGHALAIANSGGGKSGLVRRLLETTHGRVQQLILDPEDELYTLRERFDFVIAGGDNADVPATIAGAGALALHALEHGYSLVVQLNDLVDDAAPEFVASFLRGLMSAPQSLWRPVLVVIDELQRFAPSGPATAASKPVKDLVQRGRKRGFTLVGASTAMTEIDPRVRGLVNNWLLGRVGQALDRNTMAAQLGFTAKEGREHLRSIEKRQFWGLGPAIAADPVLFRVGDVETTPVQRGQAKPPTPPAPEALREILQGLAAAAPAELPDDTIPPDPTEAWEKGTAVGSMVVERDQRISELEARLSETSVELGWLRGHFELQRRRRSTAIGAVDALVQGLNELRARLIDDDKAPDRAPIMHPRDANMHPDDANSQSAIVPFAKGAASAGTDAGEKSGAAPTLNLTATDFASMLLAAAPDGFSWEDGLLMIGRRPGSGDAGKARSALLQLGLMRVEAGQCHAGPRLLEHSEITVAHWPGPEELVDLWADKLRGPGGNILRDLSAHGPSTKSEVAARIGKAAGSGWFGKGMKDLRRSKLVTDRAGRLELHPFLSTERAEP